MPAELKGSVYATRKGYGIRWLENGRRRYEAGFETKRDARRWFDDEIRPRLHGRRRESSSSTVTCRSPTSNVRRSRSRLGELRFPSACATPRRRRSDRRSPPLWRGS